MAVNFSYLFKTHNLDDLNVKVHVLGHEKAKSEPAKAVGRVLPPFLVAALHETNCWAVLCASTCVSCVCLHVLCVSLFLDDTI